MARARAGDRDKLEDRKSPAQKADDEILKEARSRFERAMSFESNFRGNYSNDLKFVHADPDNHAQWPDEVYNQRTSDTNKRPTMTANVTFNIANFIINNTRMNLPAITIKPTGDQSTFESAEAYESIVRHIQYRSQATNIYVDAHSHQVWGGVGYFRVVTRWDEENPDADEGAWNQSIFLDPLQSHMSALLDPSCKQKSGSDARWGFIYEDVDRDIFERDHPNIDAPQHNPMNRTDDWVREDSIRTAEYYRIISEPDWMIYISETGSDGKEVQKTFRLGDPETPPGMDAALREAEKNGAQVKRRKIWRKRLQWFKIVGDKIVDRNLQLPGKGNFIPIVRVPGRETIINGRMDRKGVVRMLKDMQRLFNFYLSSDAEFNALQTKSPFIGYKESFEGNEKIWNNLNTSNPAYLPVNMTSEEIDGPIPMPQRNNPPTDAPAFRNGMQAAFQYMGLISGIPDANFGRQTNEQSGLAVRERRRGGDVANYDFADALAEAVAYAGRIMIEWIPDVYDVKRTIKVMARDGTQSEITIDPQQEQAIQMEKEGEVERALFNPGVGKYEVVSEVGPSYATQREDAWEAFQSIVTRSPELMGIFGDLMFYTADFPLSDKIAERMVRQIRATAPWLLDEAPPPMVQQLNQKLEELQNLNGQLLEHIGKQQRTIEDKDRENARKEFEAQERAAAERKNAEARGEDALSKRITAVTNAQPELDRTGAKGAFDELLRNTFELAEKTTFDAEKFGAKRGKDGNYYIDDPERPGKYLQVG